MVAELVTRLVIDGLEVVEVDQDQGEGPAVTSTPRGRHFEGLIEAATIRDIRERVVRGTEAREVQRHCQLARGAHCVTFDFGHGVWFAVHARGRGEVRRHVRSYRFSSESEHL